MDGVPQITWPGREGSGPGLGFRQYRLYSALARVRYGSPQYRTYSSTGLGGSGVLAAGLARTVAVTGLTKPTCWRAAWVSAASCVARNVCAASAVICVMSSVTSPSL